MAIIQNVFIPPLNFRYIVRFWDYNICGRAIPILPDKIYSSEAPIQSYRNWLLWHDRNWLLWHDRNWPLWQDHYTDFALHNFPLRYSLIWRLGTDCQGMANCNKPLTRGTVWMNCIGVIYLFFKTARLNLLWLYALLEFFCLFPSIIIVTDDE